MCLNNWYLVSPVRNSITSNNMIQIPLGVNRQLLTGQEGEISNGVNPGSYLVKRIAEITPPIEYVNHALCTCNLCTCGLCTYSLAGCKPKTAGHFYFSCQIATCYHLLHSQYLINKARSFSSYCSGSFPASALIQPILIKFSDFFGR